MLADPFYWWNKIYLLDTKLRGKPGEAEFASGQHSEKESEGKTILSVREKQAAAPCWWWWEHLMLVVCFVALVFFVCFFSAPCSSSSVPASNFRQTVHLLTNVPLCPTGLDTPGGNLLWWRRCRCTKDLKKKQQPETTRYLSERQILPCFVLCRPSFLLTPTAVPFAERSDSK